MWRSLDSELISNHFSCRLISIAPATPDDLDFGHLQTAFVLLACRGYDLRVMCITVTMGTLHIQDAHQINP